MERFFDIFFSGLALLALSPLFFILLLVLKFSGEGEIFFLQERIGKDNKPFMLFKFATMLKNSPNTGTGTITIKNDPRVLPVGKFLRKSKINELPQLINIFKGDMSIIGPRPLTLETFSLYSINTQEAIKKVRPGLSGIGSIIFRDEEELMDGKNFSVDFYEKEIAPYKGQLEEWFVKNRGLSLYFLSILITAWAVIFPSSSIAWKFFKKLPKPPEELSNILKYNSLH
jgi:lipopolysaccharide/colanic/teichoic acid biosynthesis glycosyltransferase